MAAGGVVLVAGYRGFEMTTTSDRVIVNRCQVMFFDCQTAKLRA